MSNNKQYTFRRYTRRSKPSIVKPFVTLQSKGTFSMNSEARALFGPPDKQVFVYLEYDAENQAVGMTLADPNDIEAYPLRKQKGKGSTYVVAGSGFCRFNNIPTGTPRRMIPHMLDDSTMVLDLNHSEQEHD